MIIQTIITISRTAIENNSNFSGVFTVRNAMVRFIPDVIIFFFRGLDLFCIAVIDNVIDEDYLVLVRVQCHDAMITNEINLFGLTRVDDRFICISLLSYFFIYYSPLFLKIRPLSSVA